MPAGYEYIGISVQDLASQRAFYSAAFGVDVVVAESDFSDSGIRTAVVRSPTGLGIELIERTGSTPQPHLGPRERATSQGFTHLAVRVDDLEDTLRAASAAGGSIVSSPADARRPGLRFAYVSDPEGNLLELVADR